MEAIRKAVEWVITAEVPEDAMIRHLGLRHESGVRFLPVSETGRYNLPIFMFSKDWGLYSDYEIAALRQLVQEYGIVNELVGKTFYTVTVNIVANPSIFGAYNRYMEAIQGVGLDAPELQDAIHKTPLPEGWTW